MLDNYPETLIGVEWHSPSFTPTSGAGSDFDLPSAYNIRSGYYNVGGIPHSQFNGDSASVGGAQCGNYDNMIDDYHNAIISLSSQNTPYQLDISGVYTSAEDAGTATANVAYDVTLVLDDNMDPENMEVDLFVIEDKIFSYWSACGGLEHDANNVARRWLTKLDDQKLHIIIPAFMLSELKKAFEIGFLIYLPFLIIDLVIASVLMAMGMMMLPPVVISLPFKLIFLIEVVNPDGKTLILSPDLNTPPSIRPAKPL